MNDPEDYTAEERKLIYRYGDHVVEEEIKKLIYRHEDEEDEFLVWYTQNKGDIYEHMYLIYPNLRWEYKRFADKKIRVIMALSKKLPLVDGDLTIEIAKTYPNLISWEDASEIIPLKDILENPDLPWDFDSILKNPTLTWDYVKDHLDHLNRPLVMVGLSESPVVTWDIVQKNPEVLWNYGRLTANPNITEDIVRNNRRFWDWRVISSDDRFSFNLYLENRERVVWFRVAMFHTITSEDIRDNPDLAPYHEQMSTNDKLDPQAIVDFPEKPWNWAELTYNPQIPLKMIDEHMNWPWSFSILSKVKKLTFDFVRKHIDRDWDFTELSRRADLDIDIVLKNPGKKWDWLLVSANAKVTPEIVTANPQLRWNRLGLVTNVNFTWDIVNDFKPSLIKYRPYYTLNPNMTIDTLLSNRVNWRIDLLPDNPFYSNPVYREKLKNSCIAERRLHVKNVLEKSRVLITVLEDLVISYVGYD